MQTPELMDNTTKYRKKFGAYDPNDPEFKMANSMKKYNGFTFITKHFEDGEKNTDDFISGYRFYILSMGKLYSNHIVYSSITSAQNAAHDAIDNGYIPEIPAERDFPSKNKKFICPDCGHVHGNER